MSPQQLDGAAPAESDDVYALGVLAYELATGYPPFYPDARPERVRAEAPAAIGAATSPCPSRSSNSCCVASPSNRRIGRAQWPASPPNCGPWRRASRRSRRERLQRASRCDHRRLQTARSIRNGVDRLRRDRRPTSFARRAFAAAWSRAAWHFSRWRRASSFSCCRTGSNATRRPRRSRPRRSPPRSPGPRPRRRPTCGNSRSRSRSSMTHGPSSLAVTRSSKCAVRAPGVGDGIRERGAQARRRRCRGGAARVPEGDREPARGRRRPAGRRRSSRPRA